MSTEAVRERFEAWLRETFGTNAVLNRYPEDDPDGLAGVYEDGLALDCWDAWQVAYSAGVKDGLEQAANLASKGATGRATIAAIRALGKGNK